MSKFAQIYSKKVDFDGVVSTGKLIQMKNLLEIFYNMNEPNNILTAVLSFPKISTITKALKNQLSFLRVIFILSRISVSNK